MAQSPITEAVSIPVGLLAEVQAAAAEEQRPVSEVLREALERYLRDRRWQKIFAQGEQRAQALGVGESDVSRLIAEYRQQHR